MKFLIYILLLFSSLSCFAQTETKEDFLNQVYKFRVDDTLGQYPLKDTAGTIYTPWARVEDIKADFRNIIDSISLEQIISHIKSDTKKEIWHFNKLKMAYSFKPLKNDSCKREVYYHFSKPIFDHAHKWVIIALNYHCGSLCGDGCVYVFKKVNGHWTKITTISCYEA